MRTMENTPQLSHKGSSPQPALGRAVPHQRVALLVKEFSMAGLGLDTKASLGHGFLEVLRNEVPVHKLVHEGVDVLGADVLVVEVVGMLPDIHGKDGLEAISHRVASANGLGHDKLGAVIGQPGPARAERSVSSHGEFLLEVVERAESRVNHLCKLARRSPATIWGHAVPVEGVVPGLRGVVEETLVAGLMGLDDDGLHIIAFHLRAGDHLVGHSDILRVMLVMVHLKGSLGHVGLEGCVLVRQVRQGHRRQGSRPPNATKDPGRAWGEGRRRGQEEREHESLHIL
mmetsp:Transcript_9926/g.28187  ORF Transcript_9926/g.28187 Transcript_9926/m.28187 type:complete len:286 (+) Transcript_9926:384-1241(+)